MLHLLTLFILAQATLGGIATVGTPLITGVSASPDANTIVLSWTTNVASDTSASCGSLNSLRDPTQVNVTSHSIPVPQLTPSTLYTCKVCSNSICATTSATTTAAPASTPITGISLGTVTNYNTASPPHVMVGDLFFNTVSNDGNTYITTGDSTGWNGGSACQFAAVVGKVTSLSPIAVANVNTFSSWPGCSVDPASGALNLEYPVTFGITSVAGKLFTGISSPQSCSTGSPVCLFYNGTVRYSNDHGATWNSQTNPASFSATPALESPWNATMWPNGPPHYSFSLYIGQSADDGTLGYLTPNNRVLNANAYIYGVSQALNSGPSVGLAASSASDSVYLWRVPRAQMAELNSADYQFYTGGDGTQAAAWSTSQSASTAILTNDCNGANLPSFPGCLGTPSIVYIPALNRYLMIVYYWTNGVNNPANTTWLAYESPTPWGTWTLIQTLTFTNGAYSPNVLQADAFSAGTSPTQMRVLWSENWLTGNQNLFYATMTVNH